MPLFDALIVETLSISEGRFSSLGQNIKCHGIAITAKHISKYIINSI